MASCATCNAFILMGGEKVDGFRFCNKRCLKKGGVLIAASKVADADVEALASEIHAGVCPLCQERTGVEVRKSYDIASFLIYTRHQTLSHICCRACALRKQLIDFTGSLFLGWWGVPWGLLMTPVQLLRNIGAMLFPPRTDAPSQELKDAARMILAQDLIAAEQEELSRNPIMEM